MIFEAFKLVLSDFKYKISGYFRWGLCMCESFIFEHCTFVVAHVEGTVTEPHVHLEVREI